MLPPLPHIDKPSEETLEKMKNTDYSKNPKVQAYVKKYRDLDKQSKKDRKKKFRQDNKLTIQGNRLTLIGTIATIVALFISIVQLLK